MLNHEELQLNFEMPRKQTEKRRIVQPTFATPTAKDKQLLESPPLPLLQLLRLPLSPWSALGVYGGLETISGP